MFARMSPFAFGTILTALGVLILSPDAALIRVVGMDTWALTFWRGYALTCIMLAAVMVVNGRGTWAQLRGVFTGTGLLIALLFSSSTTGFVVGADRGDPAYTVVAVAATPLFAAFFSWIIFGERADRATLIAIFFGMIGVGLGAYEVLGEERGEMIGFIAASWIPIAMGLGFTLTRYLPKGQNIWAIYVIAGLITLTSGAIMGNDFTVPTGKMIYFIPLILVVGTSSFLLISIGPRYISAAQTSLLMLVETALSPIWVYVAIQLAPGPLTLIGGIILILTLVGQTLWQLRSAVRSN